MGADNSGNHLGGEAWSKTNLQLVKSTIMVDSATRRL